MSLFFTRQTAIRPALACSALGATALLSSLPAMALQQDVFDDGRRVPGSISIPTGIATLDTDADGRLDVVASEQGSGIVYAFRDRGGADFAIPTPIIEAFEPIRGLAAGDLDGDGDDDLVVVFASGVLRSFRADATGGFSNAGLAAFFSTDPGSVELIDLNGDGALDAVVQSFEGSTGLQAALGTGTGTFSSPSIAVAGTFESTQGQYRDMDGDGDLDIVATLQTGPTQSRLVIVENVGVFPFSAASATDLSTLASLPESLGRFEAFDADGDGDVDVTLATGDDGTLQWIENLGGGAFSAVQDVVAVDAVQRLYAFDFDGDGDEDLALHRETSPFNGELRLVESLGSGAFADLGVMGAPRGRVLALTSALFDGDVLPSLVTASGIDIALSQDPARVDVLASSQAGLSAPVTLNELIGRGRVVGLDVDQDGLEDVVGVDSAKGDLVLKRSRGDGTFDEAEVLAASTVSGQAHFPYVAGDVDGDGVSDLVYVRQGSGFQQVFWRAGMAGGGLGAEASLVSSSDTPFLVEDLRLEDFDGDGRLDLFFVAEFGIRGFVAPNLGGGTVGVPQLVSATTLSVSAGFQFADVDGDGLQDLLVGVGTSIRWLRSLGGAQFGSPAVLLQTGDSLLRYALLDVDEDGRTDIVHTTAASGGDPDQRDIVWARNLGGVQFDAPLILVTDESVPRWILFEDVDLDGIVDLYFTTVLAAPIGTTQRLAFGLAPGSFAAPLTLSVDGVTSESDVQPDFLDVTGSGAPDLVASATQNGTAAAPRVYFAVALNESLTELGDAYCGPIVANSTGNTGGLGAFGSARIAVDQLTLQASELPPAAPGIFLTSMTAGYNTVVANSEGVLCLGGSIGRFVGPGQIRVTDAAGAFELDVSLDAFPSPMLGLVSVAAGETWNFQAWHRDVSVTGQATSNFTAGLAVTFE